MTPLALEEFKALRATIRERGTARSWVFVVGLVAWGGLTIATAALAALPVATLLPLLVLGGFFEAVYSLHIGVERVGRYLQVFYETNEHEPTASAAAAAWERTAMEFGSPAGGARLDPLFSAYYFGAAILNFVPAVIAQPVALEVAVVGSAHLLFIARVVMARRVAARQRRVDLERFRQLKHDSGMQGRA